MAECNHLTWADLNHLTRGELLDRLEAEQEYWARQENGGFTDADRARREEFSRILRAVCAPAELAEEVGHTAAWLAGECSTDTSYWDQMPGHRVTARRRRGR
ncbi:hypothetical protein [Saccharopolyspora endophytica]|uniref:Uncharacterized protein n=1 Tax=Saccharopolyspora endophytica TaxID=543886 RepID=A0ABS5DMK3_9PSEU|nr:hypothetical protein [Saccharopolyspora endophytica]MBQ0927536.1 hypothetical protein [Saccharopolyspora endophytica]